MEIPNIYAGDYRRLLAVPLILIVLSVVLIQVLGIQQGIELKGGVLVTLQASGPIDDDAIHASLAAAGIRDATVRTYDNPVGQVAEVEIGQNEELAAAEKGLADFNAKVRAAEDTELNLAIAEEEARLTPNAVSERKVQEARVAHEKAVAEMGAAADVVLDPLEQVLGRQIARDAEDARGYKNIVDNALADAKDAHREQIINAIGSSVEYSSYSFRDVSPTLSAYFLSKAYGVFFFSSLLVAITVFLIFRSLVPSLAVLAGAMTDVLIALGAMALFQIPLTLASFAALLMIVGFSLDTHILLTVRTLKRGEGTPRERIFDTMKTGATMSLTALTAFGTLFLLALFTHIPTYYQISSVAIFGLFGDLVAAWGMNAVIVLWYAEKKEKG